jgi:hypothetical protein
LIKDYRYFLGLLGFEMEKERESPVRGTLFFLLSMFIG